MEQTFSDLMALTLGDIGLPSDHLAWKALLLTIISLSVGILGGFVGLALGTIRLPALLLLGTPAAIAGGTNIMVSSLSSLTGAIKHWRGGRVDMRIVMVMGLPAFAGAFAGGFLSGVIHEGILLFLAGLLVLWQGVEFIIIYQNRVKSGQSTSPLFGAGLEGSSGLFSPGRVSAEAGIGLGVGLLGGAVGLILGSIRLPALVRVLKIDPRVWCQVDRESESKHSHSYDGLCPTSCRAVVSISRGLAIVPIITYFNMKTREFRLIY